MTDPDDPPPTGGAEEFAQHRGLLFTVAYEITGSVADAEDIDEIIYRLYGGRITSNKPAVRKSVTLRRGYYTAIRAILRTV